jgi:hypothetical protein
VLVGRPDIIAVKGDTVLVVDCKAAAERPAHHMQVLLYLLMLPRARKALAGKSATGRCVTRGRHTRWNLPT